MSSQTALLLGVHAHQPVGNFPEVMADAHERCYRPFLQTLHRYPDFRFAAHFSGWLLDWLIAEYPQDMALLQEMVARGQVEMVGAGDCEPVLASIPHRDRVGQINALSDKLERRLGQRPVGAWLTERVWESSVVPALGDANIGYVAVDDYHFLCTGRRPEELGGFFTTEEDGRKVDLFPISEQLRYRLPFSPAHEAVAYLESLADQGQAAAVYFDDIEKFGIWPETYEWVYNRGWLTQFIEGVLASPRLRTDTYAGFRAAHRTRGVVYLPTASYIEMNEWTLPAPAGRSFARLMKQEQDAGRFDTTKAFVRGGIWRNFFSRYPESNWMHKRMLSVSNRLAALPEAQRSAELTASLYRAQANDAFWHGLFGGLYLPHLRRAIYNNLVELEGALDTLAPRPAFTREDLDLDGFDEATLRNGLVQAIVRLDGNAALCELDSYPLRHNFADTLRRSDEQYYDKIREARQTNHSGTGIASAHDRVSFKHPIADADLVPDARPRNLFLDLWAGDDGSHTPVSQYTLTRDSAEGVSFAAESPVRVSKTFRLGAEGVEASYQAQPGPGELVVQINLAMPSCDGYAGRFVLADGHIPGGFGQTLVLQDVCQLDLQDGVLGGAIRLTTSTPVSLKAAPLHTVSLSEAGFEKIMQAVVLELRWRPTATNDRLSVSLTPRTGA